MSTDQRTEQRIARALGVFERERARPTIEHRDAARDACVMALRDLAAYASPSPKSPAPASAAPVESKPKPEKRAGRRLSTAADDEEIRASIVQGLTYQQICEKHGCSDELIAKLKNGWRRTLPVTVIGQEKADRIRARVAKGEALRVVAKAEGVSHSTVCKIAHGKIWKREAAA